MFQLYSSKIYKNAPIPIQNAIVTAKGLVYSKIKRGHRFRLFQKELVKNEGFSYEELRSLQLVKLKRLINYSYEYIPFYKKLFDNLRFRPQYFKSIDDIKKLPLLDRHTIQKHYDEFIPSNFRRKFLYKGTSSGTTGTPISLFINREGIEREHAFIWRQYRWAGCSRKSRIALFRAEVIVPVEQKKPPFWRYDAFSKDMFFSTYHISEATIESYLEQLHKFDPKLIYSYPSSLFLIAKYAIKHDYKISMPSLRGITTSSETLYKYQKRLIEKAFGVRIFDWFGQFERVIFIGTCEFGSYHIFPDYGATELISVSNINGKEHYELIGTGFVNNVMPLIRYRTGDIVTLADGPCQCRRNFPRVGFIYGRYNDAIVTPEGRIIRMIDDVFKDIEHISMAQVHQNSLNELVILVEPEPEFSISDEKKIVSNLILRVGDKMKITIKCVNKIARVPRHKFRLIISKVKIQQF